MEPAFWLFLRIFRYEGTYFDQIVTHSTVGACDTISFNYESYQYLVIGQYIDNDGNYDVGSVVYYFDSGECQLSVWLSMTDSKFSAPNPYKIHIVYCLENTFLCDRT